MNRPPIFAALIAFACILPACSIVPTYTVRVENETNRPVRATLERRPTINQVIELDSARVGAESSAVLGPADAPPLERVYVVIGDRTDIHALPESVELNRGQWIVTLRAGSVTAWGTYHLDVRKADEPLIAEPDEQEPNPASDGR